MFCLYLVLIRIECVLWVMGLGIEYSWGGEWVYVVRIYLEFLWYYFNLGCCLDKCVD